MKRTVIVTDAEQRAALAVVRSFGAVGYRCVVTCSWRPSIAGGSRFAARVVTVPDALESPEKFAGAIIGLAAAERAETISRIGRR